MLLQYESGAWKTPAHFKYDATNMWQVVPLLYEKRELPILNMSPASFVYRNRAAYDPEIATPALPDIQTFQYSKFNNKNASLKIIRGTGFSTASNVLYGSVYDTAEGQLWYAISPTGGTCECMWQDKDWGYMQEAATTANVSSNSAFTPSFTVLQRSSTCTTNKIRFCYSFAMAVNIRGAKLPSDSSLSLIVPIEPGDYNGQQLTLKTNISKILGFRSDDKFIMIEDGDTRYSSLFKYGKFSRTYTNAQTFLLRGSIYYKEGYFCSPLQGAMNAFFPPWIAFKPADLTFFSDEHAEATIEINFCDVSEAYYKP